MKTELPVEHIDPNALDIVRQLQAKNFTTYLVGGCVRDLLVGQHPKDFDIVTMASPEQVQKIIRPSFIIGKRFRLVLVRRYGQQFEISTFRSLNYQSEDNPDAINENIYGEPREDALRRDFTINGLFYDPDQKEIIDHTNGLEDIRHRTLRMIGEPKKRIEEDPIRILRALRLAHKINFSIETSLRCAIEENAHLLKGAILPRVREEILKTLRLKDPSKALWEAHDLQILKYILPTVDHVLTDPQQAHSFFQHLDQGLHGLDSTTEAPTLYSILMYSYLAALNPEWEHTLSTRFDERAEKLMRTELGMHRVETEIFIQAMNLMKQMAKHASPHKMRPRHRDHLLTNRAFELAIHLAEAYHHIAHFDTHQWRKLYLETPPREEPVKERRRRTKVKL